MHIYVASVHIYAATFWVAQRVAFAAKEVALAGQDFGRRQLPADAGADKRRLRFSIAMIANEIYYIFQTGFISQSDYLHERQNSTTSVGSTGQVAVRDLVKRYGEVVAVGGVSLDVRGGEFLALLGPSGSGKTTILMNIAGFDFPDAGRIEISGRDVTWMSADKRGLGMVFQRYTLFPHMSVLDNIAFPLRMRKVGRAERERRARAALQTVRLEGYGDRRPAQLSGGQQQRVALARAIVYNPQVLLMDEPLSALDKNLREEMQIEIKHLQRELGVTVIFVTHDQTEALTMADRIAVLNLGELQQIGVPKDLYEAPATEFVAGFIGESNFWPGVATCDVAANEQFAVHLDGGEVAQVCATSPLRKGSPVRVAVRPERVRLGLSGVHATIAETIYAGSVTTLMLRTKGPVLRARLSPGDETTEPQPGALVSLTWRPQDARAYPTS